MRTNDEKPAAWIGGLLQSCDALFPVGSYAHSAGLEELCSLGTVGSAEDFESYLQEIYLPVVARQEIPYLLAAYDAALADDLETLADLDEEVDAWKTPRELREGSRAQGRQRLTMVTALVEESLFSDYLARIRAGNAEGHHLVVFAMQCAHTGVPRRETAMSWMYQSLSGQCGAAMKLIRMGQLACQTILTRCVATLPAWAGLGEAIPVDEAGYFNPLGDLASSRHEFAFSRLFIS